MIHLYLKTLGLVFWLGLVDPFVSENIRSGLLARIGWCICISKSQICVSFFCTHSGLCIHHLFVCSNAQFLSTYQSSRSRYYYFTHIKFFSLVLTCGLSLVSEWQQITSVTRTFLSILWYEKCFYLNSFNSLKNILFLKLQLQAFGVRFECTNYLDFYDPQFFLVLRQSQVFVAHFTFSYSFIYLFIYQFIIFLL